MKILGGSKILYFLVFGLIVLTACNSVPVSPITPPITSESTSLTDVPDTSSIDVPDASTTPPATDSSSSFITTPKTTSSVIPTPSQIPIPIPIPIIGRVPYNGGFVNKQIFKENGEKPEDYIILIDNSSSTDPTYELLTQFLDKTRSERKGINTFDGSSPNGDFKTCGYYVEDLHNMAENAGIRAGVCIIEMENNVNHGINVFKTTDKDLVFVDNSYFRDVILNRDDLDIGKTITVLGFSPEFDTSHKIIEQYQIIWDGFKAD